MVAENTHTYIYTQQYTHTLYDRLLSVFTYKIHSHGFGQSGPKVKDMPIETETGNVTEKQTSYSTATPTPYIPTPALNSFNIISDIVKLFGYVSFCFVNGNFRIFKKCSKYENGNYKTE